MLKPQPHFRLPTTSRDPDAQIQPSESRHRMSTLVLDPGCFDLPQAGQIRGRELISGSSEGSLPGRLIQQAWQNPESVALESRTGSWSYRQLLDAAFQVARALRSDHTFSRGSRIALLLPNSWEYVAAFYGILLAGGVAVPLAQNRESDELLQIFQATEPAVAVITSNIGRRKNLLGELPRLTLPDAEPDHNLEQSLDFLPSGDDLAAIFFTAGSTGRPKGVMLSHRNLIANATSIQQYLNIGPADRPLCVLPFHHAYGNSVLQSHLLAGATLILDGKPMFPETLVEAMKQHRATSLAVVPDLARMLKEHSSLGQTELRDLRYMTVAGGALDHDLALELATQISPVQLFLMYGQTEATARLAFLPPSQLSHVSAGCIGRPIPGVEFKIVDEQDCDVAVGEVGQLKARGANVMLGYWQDPAGTAEILQGGWLATGDLAISGRDGWIYHKGRQNALVKIAGYRVHPGALEEFAVRRLEAAQAVAVPYESPQVGTRLALFIRMSDLNPVEMQARCHAELPRHLVPGMIRVLDSFPLNSALKLDRIVLARLAQDEASRPVSVSHQTESK